MQQAEFQNKTEIKIDDNLIHATVKLNTLLFAVVLAFICGFSLFLLTHLSLSKSPATDGSFLGLLSVFLPGYNVSTTGAWFGLLWGAVIGAISGAVIYRIYAKSIKAQVIHYLNTPDLTESDLGNISIRLDGNSLGLALGALLSMGLLITTNWLVLRGTAAESIHAALLGNYLPGYKVSFAGSLIGAVELFIIVYLFCQVFCIVYNRIASARKGAK